MWPRSDIFVPRALAECGTIQNVLWDEDCPPHKNTPKNLAHHQEIGLIWGLPCGYLKAGALVKSNRFASPNLSLCG